MPATTLWASFDRRHPHAKPERAGCAILRMEKGNTMWGSKRAWGVVVVVAALAVGGARLDVSAQEPPDPAKQQQKQEPKQEQKQRQPPVAMDPQRAQRLYVGNDIKDHSPGHNFERDLEEKQRIDRRYEEACRGVIGYQKVKYRSS